MSKKAQWITKKKQLFKNLSWYVTWETFFWTSCTFLIIISIRSPIHCPHIWEYKNYNHLVFLLCIYNSKQPNNYIFCSPLIKKNLLKHKLMKEPGMFIYVFNLLHLDYLEKDMMSHLSESRWIRSWEKCATVPDGDYRLSIKCQIINTTVCETPASNTAVLNIRNTIFSPKQHLCLPSDLFSLSSCFLPFCVSLQDAAISSARYLNINTAGALQAHFSFVKYPRYYLLHKWDYPPPIPRK